jgi:hypothetical protein
MLHGAVGGGAEPLTAVSGTGHGLAGPALAGDARRWVRRTRRPRAGLAFVNDVIPTLPTGRA